MEIGVGEHFLILVLPGVSVLQRQGPKTLICACVKNFVLIDVCSSDRKSNAFAWASFA